VTCAPCRTFTVGRTRRWTPLRLRARRCCHPWVKEAQKVGRARRRRRRRRGARYGRVTAWRSFVSPAILRWVSRRSRPGSRGTRRREGCCRDWSTPGRGCAARRRRTHRNGCSIDSATSSARQSYNKNNCIKVAPPPGSQAHQRRTRHPLHRGPNLVIFLLFFVAKNVTETHSPRTSPISTDTHTQPPPVANRGANKFILLAEKAGEAELLLGVAVQVAFESKLF
jgi:hypothetical protein